MAERDDRLIRRYIRGLWWLTTATAIGGIAELAMLRHWDGWLQLLPWVMRAGLSATAVVVRRRPTARVMVMARRVAIAAVVLAAIGVVEHVWGNHRTAPLDATYGAVWDAMPVWSRWWTAATGDVGPSPALAPAIIALDGVLLWLATLHLDEERAVPASEGPELPRRARRLRRGRSGRPRLSDHGPTKRGTIGH
jgi:hypothetical protein